jgi:HAD superfamily hydrolase (TIGR01509 family)
MFDLAEERGVSAEAIAGLREKRNGRYSELLRGDTQVLDGVEETLWQLRGRVSMGVVTGSRGEHFEIIHASTDLLPYFGFVLTREDYGEAKPAPDAYLTAMARQGLAPEDCLVVEDSERGFKAARDAGIRCLVVPNALTRGGDFSGAYKVLDGIREVVPEVMPLLV